jgi:hypothetical protein
VQLLGGTNVLPAAALNVPTPLLVKATVPVGVLAVPESVSLTVAVQIVESSTATVLGAQVTIVLVVRNLAVTAVPPLLGNSCALVVLLPPG